MGVYHGGMPKQAKDDFMDQFMAGQIRVMVATNAFGMGVDKSNVRMVLHRDIPGTLEAAAQEIGRAGRDGEASECVMLYDSKTSVRTQNMFIEGAHPSREDLMKVYRVLRERGGFVAMTIEDFCKAISVQNPQTITSIMAILIASNVVERTKEDDKILKIRFAGSSPEQKFVKLTSTAAAFGKTGSGGYIEIDKDTFVKSMGLSWPTLRTFLKSMEKQGVIHYQLPYNGSYTRLIGDIKQVDFDKLEERKKDAYMKLECVIDYASRVPDERKHDFLESYFEQRRLTPEARGA